MGKTDHNVGGLACILGLANFHNQSPYLPRNVALRDQFFFLSYSPFFCFFFGFEFTQVARQVQQERTQMEVQ